MAQSGFNTEQLMNKSICEGLYPNPTLSQNIFLLTGRVGLKVAIRLHQNTYKFSSYLNFCHKDFKIFPLFLTLPFLL